MRNLLPEFVGQVSTTTLVLLLNDAEKRLLHVQNLDADLFKAQELEDIKEDIKEIKRALQNQTNQIF